MSQEGAEKTVKACPQRMDSEKLSLEAKRKLPEKWGVALQFDFSSRISPGPFPGKMKF